ncbi:acyloxyacyl hydrolase [Anaeroselena agilis]|uniref:Acyloxyacyl hydrolase n=1 Tax=Anaeroselena agilis TaxID=3063788 RepID=A0ABU3NT41_9FIRM|nr:acyloxyacyl hydrolase [Selenomonadales bacterium 4137-cl]
MPRTICLVIVLTFFFMCLPGVSYCQAADSRLEMEWDFLKPTGKSRDLDTVSLHILGKISETKNRSVYRGITITRVRGSILPHEQIQSLDSSAVGAGPVFMVRNETHRSGKLTVAVDMSGGFIVYNKRFPVGGEHYNFMWRIGPRLIYKFSSESSLNIGYMLMHVSNGLHSQIHNPSYNAHGISFGFVANF